MTDPGAQTGVRRVLAAYDAVTSDEESLTALADLAARLQAELALLFVEDSDLVSVAGLPPARQINLRTGAAGPLALAEIEAEMRATGARLRRRLAAAADRRHVLWSFRTVRGEAVDEIRLATEAADLLVLRRRRSWGRHRSAVPDPAAVARQAGHSVLLLEHGAEVARSTAIVFRPGEQGRRALSMAVRMATAGHETLDILVPDPRQIPAATEQAAACARSGEAAPDIRFRVARMAGDDVLSDAVERARNRLLVICADDPVLQGADVWNRLLVAARAVLLVR